MLSIIHTVLATHWLDRMVSHHPCLIAIFMMIVMPLGILLTVFVCACAIMVPISFLMNWI